MKRILIAIILFSLMSLAFVHTEKTSNNIKIELSIDPSDTPLSGKSSIINIKAVSLN